MSIEILFVRRIKVTSLTFKNPCFWGKICHRHVTNLVTEKTPKSFSLKTLKNYAHKTFQVSKIIQTMETIRENKNTFFP
jgi:hypothetical protein